MFVDSVRRASDCLLIAYSAPAALSSLNVFVRELARVAGIPVLAIPHKTEPMPIGAARIAFWDALARWCDSPTDLRLYLAQDRARCVFEASIGAAVETADRLLNASKPRNKRKCLPMRAHAPESQPELKRAPAESVRELSNGSAIMAGLTPHSARELDMRSVRLASVLAAYRGKDKYKTRRQIAELLDECDAASDTTIAVYLAR